LLSEARARARHAGISFELAQGRNEGAKLDSGAV
jgi:hypothetical protein